MVAGLNNMQHRKTSWGRVLLEKLRDPRLIKKFLTFYVTQKFITAFTTARQVSLPWAWSFQSMPPHTISWRFILILFFHLRLVLPNVIFPSGISTKILYAPLQFPIRATCPAHLIFLDLITQIIFGEEYRSQSSPICGLLQTPPPVTSSYLGSNILLSTLFSNILPPSVRETKVSYPYQTKSKIIVLYIFVLYF